MTDSARPQTGVPDEQRLEGVFDALPHGALVLDADGRVLAINPPAAALLGDGDGPATRGARCCELLGCAERGSQHGPGCLADTARRPGKTIPEFRVDVASGSAWVAARRLTDGRIVAQVRPGGESDSRRAIAAWTAGRHVTIRALGRTEVEVPDAPGDQTWVHQRPGQLLKLLVTERRRPVATVEIAEALWPGGPSARNATVRALVHHLRRRLDGDGERAGEATTSIARVGGGYRLRAERVAVDVDAFEAAARLGLDDARADRAAEARGSLERAMALYRGHYMVEDAYADWSIRERERLRAVAGEVARALVDLQVGEGRLQDAAAVARRLYEIDPFDADVQRRIVALSLLRGRRSEAVRSYDAISAQMLRSFGEPPEFTLLDVADPSSVWPGHPR